MGLINELRDYNNITYLGEDDIIIIFKGYIYGIDTQDNSNDNKEYVLNIIKELCKTYTGLYDTFFEENYKLRDIWKNDFYRIIDGLYNFMSLPKLLMFTIVNVNDKFALECDNLSNYDIRHSKELYDFLKNSSSKRFHYYNINGQIYSREELLNNNEENSLHKKNTPLVKTVYHGTSSKYINSIILKGLRSIPENSYHTIHNQGVVFVTADFNSAKGHAEDSARSTTTLPCVVVINTDKLDSNKIVSDWDVANQFSTDYENTPYNNLSQSKRFNGNVIQNANRDGSKFMKFGYKGIIYPSAIKDILIKKDGQYVSYKSLKENKKLSNDNKNMCINEIEAKDINLSSFETKDELHPKIWVNNMLNSRVRLRLLDIVKDYLDNLAISWVEPEDIVLTGSIANYNWSKYSDIDIHIMMDYKKIYNKTEFVEDYFKTKKDLWSQTHNDLNIYGFPIEIFVEDINDKGTTTGLYSLESNKWLIKPKYIEDGLKNKEYIKKTAAKLINQIDNIETKLKKETDTHKIEKLCIKIKKLWDKIKGLRKEGLKSKYKEMSSGNIIYKILRRTNYLDKIWEIINTTYDKINTIK